MSFTACRERGGRSDLSPAEKGIETHNPLPARDQLYQLALTSAPLKRGLKPRGRDPRPKKSAAWALTSAPLKRGLKPRVRKTFHPELDFSSDLSPAEKGIETFNLFKDRNEVLDAALTSAPLKRGLKHRSLGAGPRPWQWRSDLSPAEKGIETRSNNLIVTETVSKKL